MTIDIIFYNFKGQMNSNWDDWLWRCKALSKGYRMSPENLQIELYLSKLWVSETFNLQIVDMTVSYNRRTKFKDGESWKGHCKTRKGAWWGGFPWEQFGRRRNVIRFGVLMLWERDEKCVKGLHSGEDLSCLVLRQRRRVLIG